MTKILSRAIVKEHQKGGVFRCQLQDDTKHCLLARVSGQMQRKSISLCVGDEVTVELSPYDLTRGRITWRHS